MSKALSWHSALFSDIRDELFFAIRTYMAERASTFAGVEAALDFAEASTSPANVAEIQQLRAGIEFASRQRRQALVKRASLETENARLAAEVLELKSETQRLTAALERARNEKEAAQRRTWMMSGNDFVPTIDQPIYGIQVPIRPPKGKRR